MDWKWVDNSCLHSYSEYTPCKEIFRAVTDEIGRYYASRGFKYFSSRPKIVYNDTQIKLEICFWSSGYNMPGQYVALEILPNFYAKELKAIGNKGFILGHTDIFYTYSKDAEKKLIAKNNFNVYKITIDMFKEIIELIDNIILPWIKKIKTADGVSEMLLIEENYPYFNSVFKEYVRLYFPELYNE